MVKIRNKITFFDRRGCTTILLQRVRQRLYSNLLQNQSIELSLHRPQLLQPWLYSNLVKTLDEKLDGVARFALFLQNGFHDLLDAIPDAAFVPLPSLPFLAIPRG